MIKVIRTVLVMVAVLCVAALSACNVNDGSVSVSIDNVKSVVFETEFPEMVELGKNQLSNYYILDETWIKDFSVYIADSEILCDEVAVFRLAESQYFNSVVAAVEQRVKVQFNVSNSQNRVESEKLTNRVLLQKDDIIVMVISEQSKEISERLQKKYGFKEI